MLLVPLRLPRLPMMLRYRHPAAAVAPGARCIGKVEAHGCKHARATAALEAKHKPPGRQLKCAAEAAVRSRELERKVADLARTNHAGGIELDGNCDIASQAERPLGS